MHRSRGGTDEVSEFQHDHHCRACPWVYCVCQVPRYCESGYSAADPVSRPAVTSGWFFEEIFFQADEQHGSTGVRGDDGIFRK